MEFEWDENKRREIMEKRGIDILYAALIFDNDTVSRADDRQEYGEERRISLGLVNGEPFTVVYTERNGVTRLITAWKGGRNDFRRYQESIARRIAGDGSPG